MSRTAWVIRCEVCQESPPAELAGTHSFVEPYVPAFHLEDAIAKLRQFMEDSGFRLLDVSEAKRFDLDDWDEEYESTGQLHEMVVSAVTQDVVLHGAFFAFPAK